ncbi:MAG: flippase-like domain-containing protein [Mycoplasmatales bacterium]|nr:flippase-like domain-containing protein [Mycoplasmatales bacterium]
MNRWLTLNTQDKILMEEIENFDGDFSLFEGKMTFGTAGIRGVMGLGSLKINTLTIAAAADSYARYLVEKFGKKSIVIIANDNRTNGPHYKQIVINAMNKYDLVPYVLGQETMMATPLLSYLIREMGAVGGVNLTASHNTKEYNGFKVYDDLGGQLMPAETKNISKKMDEINFDTFELPKKTHPKYIKRKLIDKYIGELSKISNENNSDLNVVYSPMHGTGIELAEKIFKSIGVVKANFVESQMKRDENFSSVNSPNPEDSNAYKLGLKLARKNKSDIVLLTDPDGDRVGVVVKHKKRYKYLTGDQIASVYLDYRLSKMKKIPKGAYIVKTNVSTDLATLIAEKYGVKVIEVDVGFKNIADVINKQKGEFLFAFEESYGFLIDSNISRDKDAFQGVVAISDLASFLKKQSSNIYVRLKEIWNEHKIFRNIQISKKIDDKAKKRIMNSATKNKIIGSRKVIKVEDHRKNKKNPQDLVKIYFEGGSWMVVRPSGTEPKIKIYLQTVSKGDQKLIDIIIYEKEISNFIEDSIEEFPNKGFSIKVVIKYFLLIALIAAILVIVFFKVYDAGDSNLFGNVKTIRNMTSGYMWLIMVFSTLVLGTMSAWMRKRLISFLGQKVKMRHILISSYMGIFISYVTPLSIGGDAIGYWYLRRKGFKRGPLLASFMTSTVLFQISTILQSAIFIPIGWPIYQKIFNNGSAESKAAFVLFVINMGWDIFATIMILSLTFGRIFQEWIVITAIKLLEWLPFVKIEDPGAKASSYQYEFREMRNGMKKLWSSKWIMLEVLMYEMFPRIINIPALFISTLGIVKEDLERGKYWSQVIAIDFAQTANSISLTPGGSGTAEWLNITINKLIFKPLNSGASSRETAAAWDLYTKLILSWPQLLSSVMLIITIIYGEKRNNIYRKQEKNSRLNKISISKTSTSFYKWVSIPWVMWFLTWAIFLALF